MNVNFLVIMIATVFSSSLLQTKAEMGGREKPSSNHKASHVFSKSGATLNNLVLMPNRRLFNKQARSKSGLLRGTATHMENKIKKNTTQPKPFSGSSFIHSLASKKLARSFRYNHTKKARSGNVTSKPRISHLLANKRRTAVGNHELSQNMTHIRRYNSSFVSHKAIKNGSTIYGRNHTLLNRRRGVGYLTHLIYKLNRFYSNMSKLNASKHGNILHIPFKRKEVDKLEKLFRSFISKEGISLDHNRSLPGNTSRSRLRSFVNLLTQLNKLQNSTGKQQTFEFVIDSHNASRKDFVTWDDDDERNMVNYYMTDKIEDLENHVVGADKQNCYNCAVGTEKYQVPSTENEVPSIGDEDDMVYDKEWEDLNNKIDHYIFGHKSSPVGDEFKEIMDSEKELEWNRASDYHDNNKVDKWWEEQIFPHEGERYEMNDVQKDYRHADATSLTQLINDIYDFTQNSRAIN